MNRMCIRRREIAFTETEIMNGIQHIGLPRTILSGKRIRPFTEIKFGFGIILKVEESQATQVHLAKLRSSTEKSAKEAPPVENEFLINETYGLWNIFVELIPTLYLIQIPYEINHAFTAGSLPSAPLHCRPGSGLGEQLRNQGRKNLSEWRDGESLRKSHP